MINIYYNDSDANSIKKAENKKALYESKGFKLIKTEQIGLNKFCLIYQEMKGGNSK